MSETHRVSIDLETLMALVNEVAREDPLDYADLPVDEAALRQACCLGALNILQHASEFKAEEVLYVLLSAMAKLIEENVLLHAQHIEKGAQIHSNLVRDVLERAKKGKG
ncbi:MAG: hypothetical protein ACK4FF_06515 [Limnobacter sp.]|uniref:hypothetical protein n=1 Tax=Limnobacter sp. TaxID=2003368 RepID=UPI00391B808D